MPSRKASASVKKEPARRKVPPLLNLPQELVTALCEATVDRIGQVGKSGFGESGFSSDCLREMPEDLDSIINLGLTCKALNESCAPSLFRRLYIEDPEAASSILTALLRREYVGKYVHFLSISSDALEGTVSVSQARAMVKKDRVAAKLMKSGAIPLPALVLIRTMLLLTQLQQIYAPRLLFQCHHWPDSQRLRGDRLSVLLIPPTRVPGRAPECDGALGWLQSFQSDYRPTSATLRHLSFRHECADSSPKRHPLLELEPEWSTVAGKLELFSPAYVPLKSIPDFIRPCRELSDLQFLNDTDKLADIVKSIATSDLNKSLKSLEIIVNEMDQTSGMDGNVLLSSFSHFNKLWRLWVPMPADMPQTTPSIKLPPKLKELAVSWKKKKGASYVTYKFLPFLMAAVQNGQMPATLTTIQIGWATPQSDKAMLAYLKRVLPLFEKVCKSMGIRLTHFDDDAPGMPFTSEEILRLLSQFAGLRI